MRFFKPEVSKCEVETCIFNKEKACHALNINVGAAHQECSAFDLSGDRKHRETGTTSVGICSAAGCGFNVTNLCQADGVTVAMRGDCADCMTFKPA